MPVVTNKYDKIYKKRRYELVDKTIKQSNRRFLHNDLALKIIIDCRTDKSCSLKKNLGFNMFITKGFSETSPVMHLNKHIFWSQ